MCDLQKKEDPSCRQNLIISQDDKAYICPGTSTGMASARNQKVFQSVDENVSRKLLKYDFPQSMLNITPGTHRFMEKEVCTVENKEEIKIVNDQTIVFVRPKYFVGSSASVWSSEYMKMRWSECLLFQARKSSHNNLFDSVFVKANDKIIHYVDSTEEQDVMKITCSKDCIFSEYEKERLKSLKVSLQATIKLAEENHQSKLTENEKVDLFKLLDSVKELKGCTERVIISLCNGDCKQDIWEKRKNFYVWQRQLYYLLTNICR